MQRDLGDYLREGGAAAAVEVDGLGVGGGLQIWPQPVGQVDLDRRKGI